ncbi:MAG: DUF4384 domain-containing protein [Thermodesulfobacteriota bacterium]|nr:DUF4384 domain-containing protein [Thermodesulfobacteriota bacterium]
MKQHTIKQPKEFLLFWPCLTLVLLALFSGVASAGNSIITTGEGIAALGNDKSRNQAMTEARDLAKRNAAEKAATHIQSASAVENFTLKSDIVNAFSKAVVTILEEMESGWLDDPHMGQSFRVVIRAEVVPDLAAIQADESDSSDWQDDPAAPLTVRLNSPKQAYKAGEKITLYVKGNKPFFARVVYEDCAGTLTQILPNPYRTETYFQGSTTYSLPSGKDAYTLTVVPPFGKETVTVYAATRPLGPIDRQARGPVYLLKETRSAVASRTRGIQLQQKQDNDSQAAEFCEVSLAITTGP